MVKDDDKLNEASKESGDGITLLRQAFREIRLLLIEMDELLNHPATRYDLYPRVKDAIETVFLAENASFYQVADNIESLKDCVSNGRAQHGQLIHLARQLSRAPRNDAQTKSRSWRRDFARLKSHIEMLLHKEETVFLPKAESILKQHVLVEIGSRYKQALRQQG